MTPGHCSACGQPAHQYPVSRRWTHDNGPCEWRSLLAWQPVRRIPLPGGGHEIAPLEVDLPAKFIPDQNGDDR